MLALTCGAALFAPSMAQAGGFEYSAAGTRSLGRGGAFHARADDPLALGYNPAALAYLSGYQLSLGSHLAFYDSCARRAGTYEAQRSGGAWVEGTGPNPNAEAPQFEQTYASRYGDPAEYGPLEFPQICRSGPPGPSPQLVFSGHPFEGFGFALGILAPSAVGSGTWGDGDGSVLVDGRLLPSPTRYSLVQSSLLLFHPSIGVGFAPIPELSFGFTFQWGIGVIGNINHTSISMGSQDPGDDIRTELSAVDPFVPAVIGSVHVRPIDQLDISFTARFSDGLQADGTLALTTGVNGTDQPGSARPTRTEFGGVTLNAGQPWTFALGLRYADRVVPRYRNPERASRLTGRVEDPMQNENFDLEIDAVYTHNSTQVRDFAVSTPDSARVEVCDGGGGSCLDSPLPGGLALAKGWQDQIAIRAGGDWNIIRGVFAMRAGAHWESSGTSARYALMDTIPGMRVGLHLGATLRIDRLDISIAYAHIFQFDTTVTDGNYRHVAAQGTNNVCPDDPGVPGSGGVYDPNRPVVSRDCYPNGAGTVINNGTYTAEYNIVSLSARYHFQ